MRQSQEKKKGNRFFNPSVAKRKQAQQKKESFFLYLFQRGRRREKGRGRRGGRREKERWRGGENWRIGEGEKGLRRKRKEEKDIESRGKG